VRKVRILVVDDEEDIRLLVRYALEKENWDVFTAPDGETALTAARRHHPELILLDLMLPGIDGREVCYRLKCDDELRRIPVIMLTARSEDADQVIGLGIGADDYVTKPFSASVLVARIKAVLRRYEQPDGEDDDHEVITRGTLVIDVGRLAVKLAGAPLTLTPVEFKILRFLARRPGRVFSREQIIDAAQGEDVIIGERTIDVHVVSLRRKLGDHADLIETVRGFGYRFKEQD
jgi:two-component system, OmpR family, alkaline phosphatase synthesis response regulator PhoP